MTLVLTEPAAVWHERVYVLWPVIGLVTFWRGDACDAIAPPVAATGPSVVLGPLNVQLVTLDAYHESVDVFPECTRDGVATNDILGFTAVAVTLALVPVCVQVTVN